MLQPFSCGKIPLIALYGAGVSILNCAGMASVGRSVVWRNGIPEYQSACLAACVSTCHKQREPLL